MIRIKICCIASVAEARMAIEAGASAIGLVAAMPSGPGVIPEERIEEIAAATPPPIGTFLLTSETDPARIAAQHRRCRTNVVQICDRVDPEAYVALRNAAPGVSVVQVVHVVDEASVEEAVAASAHVDAILLDSGNQRLAIKELGGTGRVHDWTLSARVVREAKAPVFLAGGLDPSNVAEAIRRVRPFGLDVCSGVRTAGALDPVKLAAFLHAAAGASP